ARTRGRWAALWCTTQGLVNRRDAIRLAAAGEGAEYLSPFTRVVGGDVTLHRRRHTAK
ncbi:unnamed protein product, partial [Pylaiella littoralis]